MDMHTYAYTLGARFAFTMAAIMTGLACAVYLGTGSVMGFFMCPIVLVSMAIKLRFDTIKGLRR